MATQNRTKAARTEKQIAAQFKPGQSGNPGGRKKTPPEVTQMMTSALPEMIQLVIETAKDPGAKPELRIQCANTIIDRVLGKAQQPIRADVYKSEQPVTLQQIMERARELLGSEDG